MKKRIFQVTLTAVFLILLIAALALAASAEGKLIAEGYCVSGQDGNGSPVTTNIKWEIYDEDGTGVIYFSIDKSKGNNTVLHVRQASGAELVYWNNAHYATAPWGEYTVNGTPTVTKAFIGDGITAINGSPFCGSKITTLEIPKSLTVLGGTDLARASKLTTVNIKGEEPNEGVINLSYVTKIGNNAFESMSSAKKYIFNPKYSGEIKYETFKYNSKLTELDLPEGVTKIDAKAFNSSNSIQRIIFRGKNVEFNPDAFGGLSKYPRIVGYVGSAVDTYAKANGFTFINIETNETVYEGTKPLVEIPTGGEDTDDDKPPVIPDELPKFDPTGATAYGHMTGEWDGSKIIDTYWAYYQDTKTIKFTSNTKNYNESGSLESCDDKIGWKEYLGEIEHIIVGPYIGKLSQNAFNGMSNIIDVQLSPSVTQMNGGVFGYGASNLTTVWIEGNERIEGLADFSGMKLANVIGGTKIVKLKLAASNKSLDDLTLPSTLETVITPNFNDAFDAYCKEHLIDLQDANNPANVKNYFIRLDPSWTKCGERSAFSFDKATGTLTIHGVGATMDIANYFGGNSKNQPWFSIKQEIKHVVVTEHITGIGKYAFTECKNLETVQLTSRTDFVIGNGAFQQCPSLKSIYVEGSQPIEGTLDLRTVSGELPAWTFAYDYLIANIIVSETTPKIGKSTFEENVTVNLKGVYGTPGSYAEKYAKENNLAFYDIVSSTPSPITCTPPETVDTSSGDDTTVIPPEDDTTVPSDTKDNAGETASPIDSGTSEPSDTEFELVYIGDGTVVSDAEEQNSPIVAVVIVIAVVAVALAAVAVLVVLKKKSAKKQ